MSTVNKLNDQPQAFHKSEPDTVQTACEIIVLFHSHDIHLLSFIFNHDYRPNTERLFLYREIKFRFIN